MCVVSNIGDMGHGMWPNPWKSPSPYDFPSSQPVIFPAPYTGPTKEQFEEFLKLMRQAKKFDKVMGLADCEQAEKVKWLKELGEYLGCDVSDLVQ